MVKDAWPHVHSSSARNILTVFSTDLDLSEQRSPPKSKLTSHMTLPVHLHVDILLHRYRGTANNLSGFTVRLLSPLVSVRTIIRMSAYSPSYCDDGVISLTSDSLIAMEL